MEVGERMEAGERTDGERSDGDGGIERVGRRCGWLRRLAGGWVGDSNVEEGRGGAESGG